VVEGVTIWEGRFFPVFPFHVHLHGWLTRKLVRKLASRVEVFHYHTPLVPWYETGRPALVTVHTPMKSDTASIPARSVLGWLIKLQAPISYRLEQMLFERAGMLTAVASSVAEEMAAYGIMPGRVSVLGNGVDTDVFFPAMIEPDRNQPYFFSAGRLAPRKGLEDLVECARLVLQKYPDHRFLIAGTGPLERMLRGQIERRNLGDRVILLGHVSGRASLADLYRGATAFVHAAHYEGLPTVLLEAMACGRPVVSTAVSGALDVIEHEHNGLLVPPREPVQLSAAITRLIQDPSLAENLGTAACRTIEERYSWHVVARRYLAEYEALLHGAAQ